MRIYPTCDKDGGHTIRSVISENPMLHANFTALSSMEPELLKFQGIWRDFAFLLLWAWPWPN